MRLPWDCRGYSRMRTHVEGFGFRLGVKALVMVGKQVRIQGSGFRIQGSGFRIQGSGFRV